MALSIDQFLVHLTGSGLLSADDVSLALSSLPNDQRPQDGEQLAVELVRQKKLTKFQAEQLYAGKGTSLTLGNYVILDKLGQGGMGMVLKAWHRRMERTVALKVISPKVLKDAVALKRFQREVVAAAKLTHPNIVAAYDADEAKGTHFLVMEHVEGADLSSWVKQHGLMPVEQAVNCIAQAARGLAYAHEQGVVHRDIKPHNLLLDRQGTVKILDMGLARIEAGVGGSAEYADLTNSGAMMGTVDYMAPEQAMDSKHADARSDIYSLGCTLFYLLTGHATFVADTVMKRLTAHQNAPPPTLLEEVPKAFLTWHGATSAPSASSSGSSEQLAALNAVFQRMVAKKPADRFQSMSEVTTALDQCRSGVGSRDGGATTADSAMRSFFQDITGEGSSAGRTAATGSPQTAVLPGANEATIVESQFAIDTDTTLHETIAREALTRTGTPKQFPRRIVVAGVLVTALLLAAGFFAMRGPSGTLHLEVGDELTHVTVGETGRVVKGASEQDLRLAPGEYVLHIEREKLAFDTDAFELTKNETVSIRVERVGRRVRAMMGNTLLGHKEEPRVRSDAATVASTPVSAVDAVRKSLDTATESHALQFDGAGSRVEIPDLLMDVAQPMTIEVWAWPSMRGNNGVVAGFVGQCTLRLKGQQWRFSMRDSKSGSYGVFAVPDADMRKPSHVAGVWDGSHIRLFVNGIHHGDAVPCPDLATAKGMATFGATSDGVDPFAGWILQARFSRIARYSDDFDPPKMFTADESTVGLYHFEDGVGSTLTDSSGHQRHGKIVDAKWVAVPAITSASSARSQPVPERSTAAISRPDRVAAEWVLSLNGWVSIREPGRPTPLISQAGQLPSREFDVTYIDLQSAVNKSRVTDDGLRNLRGLKALKGLNLYGCRDVSATGLRNLSDSQLLETIDLTFSRANDQVVEELVKLRSLKTVSVGESQVSDVGIERLCRELPVLEALSLSANSTDKCLKALAEARNLKSLHGLKSKHLTDDGIGSLLNAPQITTLNVVVATDEVLRKIEVLTQTTQIHLNLCLATPTGLRSLVKLPRLAVLGLSDSPKIRDEHLENLSEMRTVTEVHLAKSGVTDHGIKSLVGLTNLRLLTLAETAITDQVVADLSRMTNLRRLNITKTKLTAEGVDALRKALSNCRVTSDHGTFGPLPPLNDAPPAAKAPFDAAQAKKHQEAWAKHLGTTVETTNSAGTKMILIPPGEFLMGSTDEQVAEALKLAEQTNAQQTTKDSIQTVERPQHRVILTKPFRVAATEVTLAQFQKFATAIDYKTEAEQANESVTYLAPGFEVTDDCPATVITWNDAVAYCQWLSQVAQASYRLPTEAEWEFACRAGTVTQFWFGDDHQRLDETDWTATNARGRSRPVGSKPANPFSLHDLHGNAWEWCQDHWHAAWYERASQTDPRGPDDANPARVQRGGSWFSNVSACRSAHRNNNAASRRNNGSGFRVMQVLNSAGRGSRASE